MTGFESSGGKISGFILWGVKYSSLDSLGGYVDFFLKFYEIYGIDGLECIKIDVLHDCFHTGEYVWSPWKETIPYVSQEFRSLSWAPVRSKICQRRWPAHHPYMVAGMGDLSFLLDPAGEIHARITGD